MQTIQPTLSPTPEQIAFFRENGYLSVPSISTPGEIAMMRDAYDRVFEERAGRAEGNQFDLAGTDEDGKPAALPQILNPSKYAPELKEVLCRANALAFARQLLGAEIASSGDHAILKPARHGAPAPWHQDEAYWGPTLEYNSLSVWMPLQPVALENGCMQFIPGSHRLEVLPHHSINHDPRVHGLEVDEGVVDLSNPAICPLPAGGATFHLSRTLHYTAPNQSDQPRRAFIMVFGAKPQPRAELGLPERRFPWNEVKETARAARAQQAQAVIPVVGG